MLATVTHFVTPFMAAVARLDPATDACLQARNDRPFLWAVVDDIINGGGPQSCSPAPATVVGQAVWGSSFQPFIDDMRNGVGDTTKTMATFWVSMPDPDVGNADTGVASDAVSFLQSSLAPFVGALLVAAVIIGCVRAMYENRGGEFRDIVALLVRYFLIAGLLVPVIASTLVIIHESAAWILDRSTLGTKFAENLAALFSNGQGVTSAIILFILLLIGALVAVGQAGVMIFRAGIIILRTGTILLSVAVSNTETGKESLRTAAGSLVAWTIYPFVAAIVYATGFRLMGTDTSLAGNGILQCIWGIAVMLMAIFALPATLRLVSPAVAPAAGGKGVGSAVAGAATTYVVMQSTGRAA
jgi:hypothetical protein